VLLAKREKDRATCISNDVSQLSKVILNNVESSQVYAACRDREESSNEHLCSTPHHVRGNT
jgi:hypothetical protein